MADRLAVDVLLGMAIIDEHILDVLPKERNVAVYEFSLVAIIGLEIMRVNAVTEYENTET